jgi:hypothetical protein
MGFQSTPTQQPLVFKCPSVIQPINNRSYSEDVHNDYGKTSEAMSNDIEYLLQNYRKMEYDSWIPTYDEFKLRMLSFKTRFFALHLKDGGTIYESACGNGLNLHYTLEIIEFVAGLNNLTVYGNDVVESSVIRANAFLDASPITRGRKGQICVGDSTNLDYVPSNSFDIAYTGFIHPLHDPLNIRPTIAKGTSVRSVYEDYCAQEDKSQSILAQNAQNVWYASWVSELVRIAKPGAYIIIESNMLPLCEEFDDMGGVSKTWWSEAITTYRWDVDPTSLVLEDDTVVGGRYHVAMQKRLIEPEDHDNVETVAMQKQLSQTADHDYVETVVIQRQLSQTADHDNVETVAMQKQLSQTADHDSIELE